MALSQAQVVILDSSSNEDIFVCGVCKMVINSLEMFINHKNFQCVPRHHCDIDNERSCSSDNMPKQVSESLYHTEESGPCYNDISCTICKRKFKRLKCLYSHLKLHDKPSQCLVCGRCFDNASHLKRHITTHKVWPDGLNETTPKSSDTELLSYSCSYCESVLPNYSQFRAHLNNHLILKKFKCIQGECNEFYDTVENLLQHVSVSHSITRYICHICKRSFLSLIEISNHLKSHSVVEETSVPQVDQYKCSHCDATFRKPERLSLHLLTESHNKPCIHCKKAFASNKRLRMHLQIHKKAKPFVCAICNRSFHMKKYLTSHMLKHGDRHFICVICKHSFKRQDVLQRHMRTHTQRKMFKCPFKDVNNCGKEFSRKDKLKQHLKSHAKTIKPISKTPKIQKSGTLEICILPLDTENDIEKSDAVN